MESKFIKCIEEGCGEFEFTAGEMEFYANKGYPEPKRCAMHRAIKKQKREEQERKQNSPFSPNNWKY